MRGVKARTGGQRFSGTGVVKRQHSTLRRLRGRVRTGTVRIPAIVSSDSGANVSTGHEPFNFPGAELWVLRQSVALAIGAAASYLAELTR